jgi:hypothetical protein
MSFVKAVLLNKYYELQGKSAIAGNSQFVIGTFRMGHGFLMPDGSIADISPTTSVIPSVFHVGSPDMAYANGRTAISCLMPTGTIGAAESKKFSVIGLYDATTDDLVVILAGAELTLTSIDKLDISSYIDNALGQ